MEKFSQFVRQELLRISQSDNANKASLFSDLNHFEWQINGMIARIEGRKTAANLSPQKLDEVISKGVRLQVVLGNLSHRIESVSDSIDSSRKRGSLDKRQRDKSFAIANFDEADVASFNAWQKDIGGGKMLGKTMRNDRNGFMGWIKLFHNYLEENRGFFSGLIDYKKLTQQGFSQGQLDQGLADVLANMARKHSTLYGEAWDFAIEAIRKEVGPIGALPAEALLNAAASQGVSEERLAMLVKQGKLTQAKQEAAAAAEYLKKQSGLLPSGSPERALLKSRISALGRIGCLLLPIALIAATQAIADQLQAAADAGSEWAKALLVSINKLKAEVELLEKLFERGMITAPNFTKRLNGIGEELEVVEESVRRLKEGGGPTSPP